MSYDLLRVGLSSSLAKLGDVELQSLLLSALLAVLRRIKLGSKMIEDLRDPLMTKLACETPLTRSIKIRQMVNNINETFPDSVYVYIDLNYIESIIFIIELTHSRCKR